MKKIIKGTRYDTEKASVIGYASNGENVTDFSHWCVTLYKTPRSGRYFLHGQGGPMTRWAQSRGQNEWVGGEDIIPLKNRQEAFEWAQANLCAEEVEKEFYDLIEDA